METADMVTGAGKSRRLPKLRAKPVGTGQIPQGNDVKIEFYSGHTSSFVIGGSSGYFATASLLLAQYFRGKEITTTQMQG